MLLDSWTAWVMAANASGACAGLNAGWCAMRAYISRAELINANALERVEEERLAPLTWSLQCDSLDGLEKLNDELPEDEAAIKSADCAYGPWRADWVDPNPYVPPPEPEEGWGEEGPPPVPDPPPVPPAPSVSHAYYLEVEAYGHKMRSRLYPSAEVEPSFQPLPPEEPKSKLSDGEEPAPEPEEGEDVPPPPPLLIEIQDWRPSVENRDLSRGKGAEVHIVRRTTFSHAEHEAFYNAKEVPEGATEEESAAIRSIPKETSTESLVRVALGELQGLLDGMTEFPVEARSYSGSVVETARLENWGIMAENSEQINHGLLPAGQTLKMSLRVRHAWALPEAEPAPEEEAAAE